MRFHRPKNLAFHATTTSVKDPCCTQSRSQSFVPLDQRSENESSGSNHYERTKEITEFWLSGSLRTCIYCACLKWLLPELSFSDRWSRGTKLWERDCAVRCTSDACALEARQRFVTERGKKRKKESRKLNPGLTAWVKRKPKTKPRPHCLGN